MSEHRDPPRLKDEAHGEWPAGFREALAGYANSAPSDEICGRVIERVEARIGSQAVSVGSSKLPWLTGGFVVAIGIAGWFAYEHLNSRDPHLAPVPTASLATRSQLRVKSTSPVIEDVPEAARASASAPAAKLASSASVPVTSRPRLERKARVRAQAAATVESDTSAPVLPTTGDPRAELALLIRARSILRSAPARALALVEEHAARFPHSTFEEEREVLAIDAERRLGRVQAAAERARKFLKAHPGSIHRSSVESSAAGQ